MFDIFEDTSAKLTIKLRQGILDGAFLSPIDYARDYSKYRILPSVGAVSQGESGSILLFFKERVRKISTLAVDPNYTSEIVLAHILLAEKYGTAPKILPTRTYHDGIRSQADAVLLVGDAALEMRDKTNKLDLVDEWEDVTDLPYVHGIWVLREDSFTRAEADALTLCAQMGAGKVNQGHAEFRYDLDESAVSGLSEFFRMSYYHGILKDLPDIRFLSFDS